MESGLYTGSVRHVRTRPRHHVFEAPLAMVLVDLADWDSLFAGRWFWGTERRAPFSLRSRDHLGASCPSALNEAVRRQVAKETGDFPLGPVGLLTFPRSLGVGFRPVSFFYCQNADGSLHSLLAEVTNTPWRERHVYVLRADGRPSIERATCEKRMHVSPFFDLDLEYRFRFTSPGQSLRLGIACHRDQQPVFDAHMALERREISGANLARFALRHPCSPGAALLGIHWQALRLWAKRVPLVPYPNSGSTGSEAINA